MTVLSNEFSESLIEELDDLIIGYSGNGDNSESNSVIVRKAGEALKQMLNTEIDEIVNSYIQEYESEWE